MSITECIEKLVKAMNDIQANECHCLNVEGRDLTEYEASEWKKSAMNYRHCLIQTIDVLVDALKEAEDA